MCMAAMPCASVPPLRLPTSAFGKFAALRVHLPFGLDRRTAHPRYAFASYVLFLVVGIAVHVCYCHSHCVLQRSLLQVFSPVHVPFPFSSYTLIYKKKMRAFFIGGGHVMSHSPPTYVLEFSHARIQLVHTLISTFLS